MIQTCERCGKKAVDYHLHDYCASCGKNLCTKCMEQGCCDAVPAVSGMNDDEEEPEVPT